jgi:hypothetical protein
MLTGGCFCKAIRYEAPHATFNRTVCHCAMCRGTTGAPCVAWFSVAARDFRYSRGAPTVFRSSGHATRAFCPTCGTQLTFSDDASPDDIDITICSLDVATGNEPQDHTFTSSQVPWLTLADGLPTFRRSRAQG